MLNGALFLCLLTAIPRADETTDAVVDWLFDTAAELDTALAGNGFDDLQPLAEWIGGARVVGLGEATHGSREIFQMKHRLLEFLVEELGFTAFAIEASYPDCVAIDHFVVHGEGDPAAALHGQGFWTWDTEEVLALVLWMRDYNADPAHARKLRFYGVDMQIFDPAADVALDMLAKVDEARARELRERLEPLRSPQIYNEYSGLSAEVRESLNGATRDLVAAMEERRGALGAATSAEQAEIAHRHAVVARQFQQNLHETAAPPPQGGTGGALRQNVRDRSMAENTEWALRQEGPDGKVALWAHNGHLLCSSAAPGTGSQGTELRRNLGSDYFVFGFAFHHGGLQAMGGGGSPPLKPFTVGPPSEGSVGQVFGAAGIPILAVDLRSPPAGLVMEWLNTGQQMRMMGAIYNPRAPSAFYRPIVLAESFDALIFLDELTAARPNPLTRKRFGMPETGDGED